LKHEPSELAHLGGLDGVFGNLGSLVGERSMDSVIKYGQTLLTSLFGGKLNSVVDLISRSSGIKSNSATSLLGMLAPLLMGLLRGETVSRGSSQAGLTKLLMDQKDTIARLAPAGLSNALGLTSLADLGSSIKTAGASAAQDVGRAASAAASQGTDWLRWAAPLALMGLLLLGLWYWATGMGQPQNPVQPRDVAEATKPVADAASRGLERATRTAEDTGRRLANDGKALIETASHRVSLSLPGNIKLDVPEDSYLQSMVQFMNDGAKTTAPKSFVAENLDFEGTTARLAPDSSNSIDNLATIMKAFGTAKLKIEGYTDNVGDPVQNQKIALDRATSVKDALVKAGVPPDRVIAEGVGPDRPIASNDTEQGRAKNRRIELTIVSR
jgi:OmpA-OmpF porin, OOP family